MVDSTGLKIFGEGKWAEEGYSKVLHDLLDQVEGEGSGKSRPLALMTATAACGDCRTGRACRHPTQ